MGDNSCLRGCGFKYRTVVRNEKNGAKMKKNYVTQTHYFVDNLIQSYILNNGNESFGYIFQQNECYEGFNMSIKYFSYGNALHKFY